MDIKLENNKEKEKKKTYSGYAWYMFPIFNQNKKIRTGRHVDTIFNPPILKPPLDRNKVTMSDTVKNTNIHPKFYQISLLDIRLLHSRVQL